MGRLGLGSLAIFINGKVWLDTGLLPSQTCSPNMNLLASDRDLKVRIRNWVSREVVMVRLTVRAVPPAPSHPTLLQFGQNPEIWSKFLDVVKILKFGRKLKFG